MIPEHVRTGRLTLHGRVLPASNATFVGDVDGVRVVYKPVAGERPLWDFPDGTLAAREVASYLLSELTGWSIVPPTILRDGPHGVGMVQLWQDIDEAQTPVDIVPAGRTPAGYRHVFDGLDAQDQPVSLVHEDTSALRRMAVLDIVLNNADRKGGHVLPMPGGHRHGVDHGLTFHVDHKLRTVLWGWLGEPLDPEELEGVRRVVEALSSDAGELADLLLPEEIDATLTRARTLLAGAAFPAPEAAGYPVIPWPPI